MQLSFIVDIGYICICTECARVCDWVLSKKLEMFALASLHTYLPSQNAIDSSHSIPPCVAQKTEEPVLEYVNFSSNLGLQTLN